jgi:hypothetical protein
VAQSKRKAQSPNTRSMFTQGMPIGSNGRFISWLIQQLLALSIPFWWNFFLANVLGWSEVSNSPLGSTGLQIFKAITISVLGFAIGICIRNRFFRQSSLGIRVWIVPVIVLGLCITWDLFTFHLDWRLIYEELFVWSRPGYDEGPVFRDLITYPTLSSIAYSFGSMIDIRRH